MPASIVLVLIVRLRTPDVAYEWTYNADNMVAEGRRQLITG